VRSVDGRWSVVNIYTSYTDLIYTPVSVRSERTARGVKWENGDSALIMWLTRSTRLVLRSHLITFPCYQYATAAAMAAAVHCWRSEAE